MYDETTPDNHDDLQSPWAVALATTIGVALGAFAAQRMSLDTAVLFLTGGLKGAAVGMIVSWYASERGEPKLGHKGLLACTLAGAILGIALALPVAALFWQIVRGQRPKSLWGRPRYGDE